MFCFTSSFLTFSRGIEMEHWSEMGNPHQSIVFIGCPMRKNPNKPAKLFSLSIVSKGLQIAHYSVQKLLFCNFESGIKKFVTIPGPPSIRKSFFFQRWVQFLSAFYFFDGLVLLLDIEKTFEICKNQWTGYNYLSWKKENISDKVNVNRISLTNLWWVVSITIRVRARPYIIW